MAKIYISGKITGTDDYMERFAKAEESLTEHGWADCIVNPARVNAELPPESTTYKEYIDADLLLLSTCNAIYMQKGWQESLGASLELQYAMTCGYEIIFEEGAIKP